MGPNWAIRLLPYVEQASVYNQIDKSVVAGSAWPAGQLSPIAHANNEKIRMAVLAVFRCPTDANYNDIPMQIGTAPRPRRRREAITRRMPATDRSQAEAPTPSRDPIRPVGSMVAAAE